MIAITGANGILGIATISFLLKKTSPENIVAVVRDAAKMQAYADTGIQIRVADYNDPASLKNAFKDVEKVLQISASSAGPLATLQENNVVDAAREQSVKQIVYTSTLNPGSNPHFMATHTCLQTEKAIVNAGLDYTFFRNSMYMETIPQFIGGALHDGNIQYPAANGKVSFVSRTDIAEALSNVLISDQHKKAVYDITGSEAFTFHDLAGMLQSEKGLPASYTDIPNAAFRDELAKFQMPEEEIDFYISMADAIKANEFAHTDDALEQLLQRKRFALREYIKSI